MALYPKSSVVPPGGWHFVDNSSGQPERIDGESTADLSEKVLRHRLLNNRAPGNPAQEISDYICGNWPHFCTDTAPAAVLPSRQGGAQISTKTATWIAAFYPPAMGDPGVSQRVADERAAICAACPQNVQYKEGGCGSCIQSIERISFVWRRQRTTDSDKQLGACKVTTQLNEVAVHATILPRIDDVDRANLPAKCWRQELP